LFWCFFFLRKLRTRHRRRKRTHVLQHCHYRQGIDLDNRFALLPVPFITHVVVKKNCVLFLTLDGFSVESNYAILYFFSFLFLIYIFFFFYSLPRFISIPLLCNITLYSRVFVGLFFWPSSFFFLLLLISCNHHKYIYIRSLVMAMMTTIIRQQQPY